MITTSRRARPIVNVITAVIALTWMGCVASSPIADEHASRDELTPFSGGYDDPDAGSDDPDADGLDGNDDPYGNPDDDGTGSGSGDDSYDVDSDDGYDDGDDDGYDTGDDGTGDDGTGNDGDDDDGMGDGDDGMGDDEGDDKPCDPAADLPTVPEGYTPDGNPSADEQYRILNYTRYRPYTIGEDHEGFKRETITIHQSCNLETGKWETDKEDYNFVDFLRSPHGQSLKSVFWREEGGNPTYREEINQYDTYNSVSVDIYGGKVRKRSRNHAHWDRIETHGGAIPGELAVPDDWCTGGLNFVELFDINTGVWLSTDKTITDEGPNHNNTRTLHYEPGDPPHEDDELEDQSGPLDACSSSFPLPWPSFN